MDEDGKRMELEPGSALQETESQLANWYQQIDFSDVKLFIRNNIATASRSFIAIGYYLKYARDNQMYEEDGHASVWDFAMAEYGISKSTASRYMTMNDRFSEGGNSPIVAKEYRGYGKSQLQEMLYLNDEQLEQVTPDTQVKQIREIRQPAKEIPYFELPGQLSIADFPDAMPELESHSEQLASSTGNTVFSVADFAEEEREPGTVAISQQEEEEEEPELEKVATAATDEDLEGKRQADWRIRCEVLRQMCDSICYMQSFVLEQSRYSMVAIRELSDYDYSFGFGDDGCGHSRYDAECKNRQYHVKELRDNGNGRWTFQAGEVEQQIWNFNARDWVNEYRGKQQEKESSPELPAEVATVAIPDPSAEELVVDTNTCPPGNGSCRRQEWGTGPEEQKVGHKECVKCWADWKSRQKVLMDAAKTQREEGLHPEYDGENTLPATEEREELFSDSDEEDAEDFEELPELEPVQEKEEPELTDLQIAQEELEQAQNLLRKCLLDVPDESDICIRRLKTQVAALACYVCDLEDIENPPPEQEQPELPLLKNNDQRAAFVDGYEAWPLWIETVQTGERYYRYDLEDGTSIVVKVYHARLFDYTVTGLKYEERFSEGWGKQEYYLLRPGKFFKDCETNRSSLIDKLKEIQKKEKQKQDE